LTILKIWVLRLVTHLSVEHLYGLRDRGGGTVQITHKTDGNRKQIGLKGLKRIVGTQVAAIKRY